MATTMSHDHTYEAAIKKLPDSEVEIKAVIPAAEFDATRSRAIQHIGKDIELPGFRKGHVPEKVLVAKIGEAAILEEMAEIALSHAYGHILMANKIDALGRQRSPSPRSHRVTRLNLPQSPQFFPNSPLQIIK